MADKFAGGIKAGSTSVSLRVNLGAQSGLAFDTAGLTAYYWRQGGSKTAITLATLAAINSAYSSGGFKEVNSGDVPALYRLDVPDAALATGADWVTVVVNYNNEVWFMETYALETERASQASVNTIDDFLDTEIAAILAAVDTEIAAIKTQTDKLTFNGSNEVASNVTAIAAAAITAAAIASDAITAAKIATDAGQEIADALLDRSNGIETSMTLRQALRIILSAAAGKLSGAATTTVNIRDVGDTKNRISATVDADGNRSAVSLDAT